MNAVAILSWLYHHCVALRPDGHDLLWTAGDVLTDQQADQLEARLAANKAALLRELTCVRLDFETVSERDLKQVGAYKYLADPSTKVHSLAWRLGGTGAGSEIRVWHPGEPLPAPLIEAARSPNMTFVSHGEFDRLCWNTLLVPQGWPPVALARWSDTMARCRAYRAPARLAKAALRLELGEKDEKGKKLIAKLHAHARGERRPLTPQEQQEFDDYAITDAGLLRDLDRLLPELSQDERAAYDLGAAMNGRGLSVDLILAGKLEPDFDDENQRLNAQMLRLCGLKASNPQAVLAWLRQHADNPPADMQKETLKEWLAAGGSPPQASSPVTAGTIRQVVETRLEFASSAGSKLKTMQAMAEPCIADGAVVPGFGVVRGCFIPHGAHTGRFSARGIQPQNFPKPPRDYDPATLGSTKQRIAYALRATIAAPPGYLLVAADLAQVESRVLCGIARQQDMLDLYRSYDAGDKAADPYLATAVILGKPGDRLLGKFLTLSAGYGIGWRGLVKKAPGYGLVLAETEAATHVAAWREANLEIVAFWHSLFEVFKEVASEPVGCSLETYGLTVSHEDSVTGADLLRIVLPSGRSLLYHQPRFEPDAEYEWRDELHYWQAGSGDWFDQRIWHGLLVENVVQAIAYDLLLHDMLQIEAAGIPLVGTVHDEAVALTKEQEAEAALLKMLKIMQTPPAWAADLPLWAEGYKNNRYIKPEK